MAFPDFITPIMKHAYHIFQKEKPWEKIFSLNKLNYNEEQLGQSKKIWQKE